MRLPRSPVHSCPSLRLPPFLSTAVLFCRSSTRFQSLLNLTSSSQSHLGWLPQFVPQTTTLISSTPKCYFHHCLFHSKLCRPKYRMLYVYAAFCDRQPNAQLLPKFSRPISSLLDHKEFGEQALPLNATKNFATVGKKGIFSSFPP